MGDWKYVQRNKNTGQYKTTDEGGGGGGGSSTLSGLDDVNISSATDGQVLKYDNATSKWVNANESGGGHIYSTTEQVIGTWIDGKPLYEKTFKWTGSYGGTSNNLNIVLDNADYAFVKEAHGIDQSGSYIPVPNAHPTSGNLITVLVNDTKNKLGLRCGKSISLTTLIVTIRYTKSTD